MRASLYDAEHPAQPLYRDAKGCVRFRANTIVALLVERNPVSLNALLANPDYADSDKRQLVQLLGWPLARVHAEGWGCDPLPASRLRRVPIDRMRHPVQPLTLDKLGTLRFKRNSIVDELLKTGPLDLNRLAVMDLPALDWDQLAQLIGYSHAGAPSYLSLRSFNAAEREWVGRQARVARQDAEDKAQTLDKAFPADLPAKPARARV